MGAGSVVSSRRRTADLRPEKLKSHEERRLASFVFESGRGSWCFFASPSSASFSRLGPPGILLMPRRRAVLSNASPMLSSRVEPRMVCWPRARESTSMLCLVRFRAKVRVRA